MKKPGRSKPFLILSVMLMMLLISIASFAAVSLYMHTAYAAPQQGQHKATSTLTPGQDWPEFHGDAARDGNDSSDTVINKSNATSLVPVTGPGFTTTGSAEDSPVVYQGIVYYSASQEQNINGQLVHSSTMYAVNASTGAVIWNEPIPTCGTYTNTQFDDSTAAVTTGLVNGVSTVEVFMGYGTSWPHTNGCVFDLNGTDGSIIWDYASPLPVFSSPSIISTNSGNIVVVGDDYHEIQAFSVDYSGAIGGTGQQLWHYDDRKDVPPSGYSQYCSNPPILCGGSVWSSPAEGLVTVNGTPHHYLYFGIGNDNRLIGRIDAIDMDHIIKGQPKAVWQTWDPNPQDENEFGTISVLTDQNGYAIRVFAGNNTGEEVGLDAVTGALYFDFQTTAQYGGTQGHIISNAALVTINGTTELIFGTNCGTIRRHCAPGSGNTGFVWALNALSNDPNGTVIWRSQYFGDPLVSSPTIVNTGTNAVAFIMGSWAPGDPYRGDLIAFDPMTGSTIATYSVFNGAYGTLSTPTIWGSRIFVTEGYNDYSNPDPSGGGLAAFDCSAC